MIIIYEQNDKAVVIHPTQEWLANNTIEDLAKKDVPEGVEYHIVEDTVLPEDRTFRDAWVLDGATIKIDAEKQAVIQTKLDAMENE